MRFHGWQLPYHPLQVSAVAIFFALSFAYYVFFVPFVGSPILLYAIIAIHSPLIASVFLLYVLCAAIDPADPGVVKSKKYGSFKKKRKNKQSSPGDMPGGGEFGNLSSVSAFELKTKEIESRDKEEDKDGFSFISLLACTPCTAVSSSPENEYLFCSLCKVQIYQCSKHCRVCDKCVDGFDHHCRWLNNCIGKKNYRAFIALLISGMAMFIMQWSVGIWVIIRCFLYRRIFKEAIILKLGSSFSLIPYLFVVGICTILALVATFPLVQLFFFHLLLIKKGLTTYDYIVAMREEDEEGMDAIPSPLASPVSSVSTANSEGSSSIGALQRGSWCTPPHVFMDHEQSVTEVDMVRTMRKEIAKKKATVSINPWALARLDTEDVKRAAAEARSNSSILRNLGMERNSEIFAEGSNIYCNTSSTPTDNSILTRSSNSAWHKHESLDIGAQIVLPLPLEARSDFCANWPSSVGSSPSSLEACFSKEDTHKPICELEYGTSSDGYDASGGESLDDND